MGLLSQSEVGQALVGKLRFFDWKGCLSSGPMFPSRCSTTRREQLAGPDRMLRRAQAVLFLHSVCLRPNVILWKTIHRLHECYSRCTGVALIHCALGPGPALLHQNWATELRCLFAGHTGYVL